MAIVRFNHAQVLAVRAGKSQKGTDWSRLQFLDQDDLQVFEIMAFGPDSTVYLGLIRGTVYQIDFQLVPARDGGVSLVLVAADVVA